MYPVTSTMLRRGSRETQDQASAALLNHSLTLDVLLGRTEAGVGKRIRLDDGSPLGLEQRTMKPMTPSPHLQQFHQS